MLAPECQNGRCFMTDASICHVPQSHNVTQGRKWTAAIQLLERNFRKYGQQRHMTKQHTNPFPTELRDQKDLSNNYRVSKFVSETFACSTYYPRCLFAAIQILGFKDQKILLSDIVVCVVWSLVSMHYTTEETDAVTVCLKFEDFPQHYREKCLCTDETK